MSSAHVVIITGILPADLQAAANVMAYFVTLGCTLQSSDLHGTTFLYTLTNPRGFYNNTDYLTSLQGIHTSSDFSKHIRQYPARSTLLIVASILILCVLITRVAICYSSRDRFRKQATYRIGPIPTSIKIADIDDDVKLDIIVTNAHSDNVGVLLINCVLAQKMNFETFFLHNSPPLKNTV
ncbi:hypothetical protein I4U23_022701 [Adineta vaga]|nr:hypothetical protein I4U23_022701 [Adineta vaga]